MVSDGGGKDEANVKLCPKTILSAKQDLYKMVPCTTAAGEQMKVWLYRRVYWRIRLKAYNPGSYTMFEEKELSGTARRSLSAWRAE